MVGGVKRDGIELLLGEIPSIGRDRPLVVTGGQKEHTKDGEEATAHRCSFDNVGNQTQDGNGDHRLKREREAPAIAGARHHS